MVTKVRCVYALFIICAMAAIAGRLLATQESTKNVAVDDLEERVRQAAREPTPRAVARSYEACFDKIDLDEIRVLKSSSDDGVALRSAWEEIRQTLPKEKISRSVPLNPLFHYRFLGFVEGRLRVSAPARWQTVFLSAQSYSRNDVVFWPEEPKFYRRSGLGLECPIGMLVRAEDGDVTITVRDDSTTIHKELFEEIRSKQRRKGPTNCINVWMDSAKCYLVLHSKDCVPYTVAAIDRTAGKLLWTADVWASGGLTAYSGAGFHWVTIVVENDRLILFGAGAESSYVEAFNPSDGANLFRFSTSY